MLDCLKHGTTIGQMRAPPLHHPRLRRPASGPARRSRAQPVDVADCPWCHAPARVVREEWLFDATELREQAAHFGRMGGLKGGCARAEPLSSRKRSEIARRAAAARWRRT
jgi:hypothetical protein